MLQDSRMIGDTKQVEAPKDYIHVRARRGQATDSHSLEERVTREKISERMKLLQNLVPNCDKVIGSSEMDKPVNEAKDSTKEPKTPNSQEQASGTATCTVNPDWTGFQVVRFQDSTYGWHGKWRVDDEPKRGIEELTGTLVSNPNEDLGKASTVASYEALIACFHVHKAKFLTFFLYRDS
ncbi:hypothetical protein L2E82_14985 [Cichorium intybus]|uniref:Uncharacterized protein n=1 Tax=Cichorium intybus TaxID=13427 RepID=A0ACB9F2S3_CICIN|nr:hypothetical protein L2E82_14985 [Cichorium intybus]